MCQCVIHSKDITFHVHIKYLARSRILKYNNNLRIVYFKKMWNFILSLWTNTCPLQSLSSPFNATRCTPCYNQSLYALSQPVYWYVAGKLLRCQIHTRVGTLIVATIYLQLIQNRYMFRSFTVLQCSHQHCVQPVSSDVEVVGYL